MHGADVTSEHVLARETFAAGGADEGFGCGGGEVGGLMALEVLGAGEGAGALVADVGGLWGCCWGAGC